MSYITLQLQQHHDNNNVIVDCSRWNESNLLFSPSSAFIRLNVSVSHCRISWMFYFITQLVSDVICDDIILSKLLNFECLQQQHISYFSVFVCCFNYLSHYVSCRVQFYIYYCTSATTHKLRNDNETVRKRKAKQKTGKSNETRHHFKTFTIVPIESVDGDGGRLAMGLLLAKLSWWSLQYNVDTRVHSSVLLRTLLYCHSYQTLRSHNGIGK